MALLGVVIAWLTVKSRWQSRELRDQLQQVDSESYLIGDEFKDHLRQLNESLYRYGRSQVPTDVPAFDKASHDLDLWIDQQKPKLSTPQEKLIMQQIDQVYDQYLRAARKLLVRLQAIDNTSASMDDYENVRSVSERLFDLGQNLSRAHLASKNALLARASHTINELRTLVLLSLGLLFVFALALALAVYRDMIKPLRLQLVESETLRERQEKLASLGVLAAGVAHEIRNPLTAIKAALFVQQKKFQPGSPAAADAKVVDREIQRLERIVNDFLLFARPGDSKLAPITADAPLRKVRSLLAPDLVPDNIQIIVEKTPALPVSADADQIEQVLINLVRNAAEAIGQDGVIKLRARADRKRFGPKDHNVVILEVEDNGKGISSEVQKRLFDPFFTTKETGTGLGLSIAARIVQSHGGRLEYQTRPGAGTTFGIVLPAAVGDAAGRAD